MDVNGWILISLPQYPALALLDVARPPRRVEMVEGDQALLDVRPGAHLLHRTQQYPHPPRVHGLEQRLFLEIGVYDFSPAETNRKNIPRTPVDDALLLLV